MGFAPEIEDLLKIGSGIFWSLTYILIIVQGFRHRTYGMPLVALAANLAWEFTFTFVYPRDGVQAIINPTWLALDVIIVYQAIRYGPRELRNTLSAALFYPVFFGSIVIAFLIIVGMSQEFQNWNGLYAAFGQNFLMSVLFITMLQSRQDLRGQSLYIGIFKMVGTIFSSLLFFGRYPDSLLLNTLYLSIVLADGIYVGMLYATYRRLGLSPWRMRAGAAVALPAKS